MPQAVTNVSMRMPLNMMWKHGFSPTGKRFAIGSASEDRVLETVLSKSTA